jgi:hypothetical protein
MGSIWFWLETAITSLNSVNQLIFVAVNFGVLFEVRTEFLNKPIIYTNSGFKGPYYHVDKKTSTRWNYLQSNS